jgi:hypothetical protein
LQRAHSHGSVIAEWKFDSFFAGDFAEAGAFAGAGFFFAPAAFGDDYAFVDFLEAAFGFDAEASCLVAVVDFFGTSDLMTGDESSGRGTTRS